MIIMGQWTRVENNNEVLLRVTNHTGQVEKNLLGPAGIRTRDLRFTSPMLYQLMVRHSEKHLIIILHPSSLSHNNHLNHNVWRLLSRYGRN